MWNYSQTREQEGFFNIFLKELKDSYFFEGVI